MKMTQFVYFVEVKREFRDDDFDFVHSWTHEPTAQEVLEVVKLHVPTFNNQYEKFEWTLCSTKQHDLK